LADQEKEVIRDESGRFVPGKSGNPKGRPLGAKNRIVKAKQDLEVLLREDILKPDDIREVWEAMVQEAKDGNVSAGKLILDKVVSQANSSEDVEKAGGGFTVVVKNLSLQGSEAEVIEGEVIEEDS
jgi:hypothetical protein